MRYIITRYGDIVYVLSAKPDFRVEISKDSKKKCGYYSCVKTVKNGKLLDSMGDIGCFCISNKCFVTPHLDPGDMKSLMKIIVELHLDIFL